jgi:hypothetical protein
MPAEQRKLPNAVALAKLGNPICNMDVFLLTHFRTILALWAWSILNALIASFWTPAERGNRCHDRSTDVPGMGNGTLNGGRLCSSVILRNSKNVKLREAVLTNPAEG